MNLERVREQLELAAQDADIEILGIEAAGAGDLAQSGLCAIALGKMPTRVEIRALAIDWPGLNPDALCDDSRRIARAHCLAKLRHGGGA